MAEIPAADRAYTLATSLDAHGTTCSNCRRGLGGLGGQGASIVCAECPNFELCLHCFSSGAEVSPHRNTHRYRVRDNPHAHKIFRDDWSAAEELALLDAIEKHGVGNWKDVADQVGSKTERRCEEHYLDDYLGVHGAILPPITLKRNKSTDELEQVPTDDFLEDSERAEYKKRKYDEKLAQDTKKTTESDEKTSETKGSAATGNVVKMGLLADPRPGVVYAREKLRDRPKASVQHIQEKISKLPGASLTGYMPLRGDFDVEHENDAEVILADMEFSPMESAAERGLKLAVLQIYNAKLDERERRKRFVTERGLLDYKKQQNCDRRRPKDERDLIGRMRLFARFHSAEEHENFLQGLLTAKRLRKRIQQLQHYRQMGIRTLKEGEEYESPRRKRHAEMALRRDQQRNGYLLDRSHDARAQHSRGRRRRESNHDSAQEKPEDDRNRKVINRSDKVVVGSSGDGTSANVNGSDEATAGAIRKAPGADLLSDGELELCVSLGLLPKYYAVVKDALLRESMRLGYLTPKRAHQLVKVQVTKTERLFDFFVSCGWITAASGDGTTQE
uniref:Transcriptional adapter n=1 Tax=Octactis speculum TaxID=3111310 RepID=A0A7S2H024_9STRA|mmetsp:Transcript_59933/g.82020  ORF Transcript_59933/g.82020 Transcript_59933/m.82020 type:complete len:561 (+) Transcript_59933:61-1743(+)